MNGPIVECVANVSEGRRPAVISALASAIKTVESVKLLHVDPGQDANRTVFTFAGPGMAVLEAAFQLFAVAYENIDMRKHRGNHPRMGLVDVCPFVPLAGADLAYCSELARSLGSRVWEAFSIPSYLYEAAASAPHRKNLADVRRGEYEGLQQKMQQPDWLPDFGTSNWNPRTGTAIIGARPFLIAWNINLATKDVSIARALAAQLRGSGRMIADDSGKKVRQPGKFPGLKAIGWVLEEHGICQVSTNVVDPDSTSLFAVYQSCVQLARAQFGIEVTGSELIGLVPEKYLLRFTNQRNDADFDAAVEQLGLADLGPFEWRNRVLEKVMDAQ